MVTYTISELSRNLDTTYDRIKDTVPVAPSKTFVAMLAEQELMQRQLERSGRAVPRAPIAPRFTPTA